MVMHWPQITLLAMIVFGLGISAARHGKPRSLESFWISAMGAAINLGLLTAGGFFGH